jgi:hypothetical protein
MRVVARARQRRTLLPRFFFLSFLCCARAESARPQKIRALPDAERSKEGIGTHIQHASMPPDTEAATQQLLQRTLESQRWVGGAWTLFLRAACRRREKPRLTALSPPPARGPSLSTPNNRPALAAAAAAHRSTTRAWLGPALATDAGTVEFYGLLEASVASPAFVARVESARAAAAAGAATKPPVPPAQGGSGAGDDVSRPEWWEEPPQAGASASSSGGNGSNQAPHPPSSPEALDSYVFVDRADVVDAVAAFVAAYLATLPDAAGLTAPQLAGALGSTLRELRRGRAARLWAWGKSLYRAAAVASAAFGAYTHPWLARALLAAVWTSVRALLAGLG